MTLRRLNCGIAMSMAIRSCYAKFSSITRRGCTASKSRFSLLVRDLPQPIKALGIIAENCSFGAVADFISLAQFVNFLFNRLDIDLVRKVRGKHERLIAYDLNRVGEIAFAPLDSHHQPARLH